ncbi:hypothetical protein Tco_1122637 [Tanacetum coccineum]|uniref:Reverse transcriptase domain-containing protein n=1 Tax=Tanacetum coccineum TaxID=301880 RepID=A0ABQ5J145_9ASTR
MDESCTKLEPGSPMLSVNLSRKAESETSPLSSITERSLKEITSVWKSKNRALEPSIAALSSSEALFSLFVSSNLLSYFADKGGPFSRIHISLLPYLILDKPEPVLPKWQISLAAKDKILAPTTPVTDLPKLLYTLNRGVFSEVLRTLLSEFKRKHIQGWNMMIDRNCQKRSECFIVKHDGKLGRYSQNVSTRIILKQTLARFQLYNNAPVMVTEYWRPYTEYSAKTRSVQSGFLSARPDDTLAPMFFLQYGLIIRLHRKFFACSSVSAAAPVQEKKFGGETHACTQVLFSIALWLRWNGSPSLSDLDRLEGKLKERRSLKLQSSIITIHLVGEEFSPLWEIMSQASTGATASSRLTNGVFLLKGSLKGLSTTSKGTLYVVAKDSESLVLSSIGGACINPGTTGLISIRLHNLESYLIMMIDNVFDMDIVQSSSDVIRKQIDALVTTSLIELQIVRVLSIMGIARRLVIVRIMLKKFLDFRIVQQVAIPLCLFEEGDFILEEIEACLTNDSIPLGIDDADFDSEGDLLLLEKLLNDDPSSPLPPKELHVEELKIIKSSIDDPPELELKDLPSHLEYAFLEGTDKLPVIIAKNLKEDENVRLLKVLKSHKCAIAWKISDINGIDPQFCNHKILMENDSKLAIQHQRRVNTKIHEVIKKEVIKLLDAGLIYLISDSPWVSPIHCVPKKGGMTVIKNEANELIPTRLVTGWRWILLLQEFDVIIRDKKEAENLAAAHLSRLKNPHQDVLENKEITKTFPIETLGMVTFRGDSSTPWFADIANYHEGNFIVKGMSSQQKKNSLRM